MANIGDLVVNLVANTNPLTRGLGIGQSSIRSFASKALGMLAPVTAALGLGASAAAARDSIAAQKKLAAVLEATGGAAGLTADEITTLASDLQSLTNFEDDATVSAAGVLATFKEIKGDTFKAAIVSAQDLSAVMGQDLQSSIVQIGKALNNPIKGVTALQRVGVSFTEQQKEQIKALQESGDLMGAQAVILKELQGEFGGAAKAMADPWTQFNNMLGDVAENIGAAVLPVIKAITDEVTFQIKGLTENGDAFTAMGNRIANIVRAIINWFKEWGGVIATTIKWFIAIKVAALAFAAAQKAVAIASTLAMAASGPMGWAQIATGAVIAAAAVAQIEMAYAGVAAAARDAGFAMGEANLHPWQAAIGNQDNVSSVAPPIPKLPGRPADEVQSIVKDSEQATDAIGDLLDQLAIAKGQFTATDVEARKLREGGASEWQVNHFIAIAKQLEDVRAATEAARKAQEQFNSEVAAAEQLTESLRTPFEVYHAELDKIRGLFDKGLIDQTTFDRARAMATDQWKEAEERLAGDGPTMDQTTAGAATRGSTEAFSAITQAMFGKQNKSDQKTAANTAKTNVILQGIAKDSAKTANAIGNLSEVDTFL